MAIERETSQGFVSGRWSSHFKNDIEWSERDSRSLPSNLLCDSELAS